MIELKKHELEQVDGGLVPLVVGAGFAVGMALAYMTRKQFRRRAMVKYYNKHYMTINFLLALYVGFQIGSRIWPNV